MQVSAKQLALLRHGLSDFATPDNWSPSVKHWLTVVQFADFKSY